MKAFSHYLVEHRRGLFTCRHLVALTTMDSFGRLEIGWGIRMQIRTQSAGFMVGLAVSLLLFSDMTGFGQSLGDIARQERERKKDQATHATHVYTNDDLKKSRILLPEDLARVRDAIQNQREAALQRLDVVMPLPISAPSAAALTALQIAPPPAPAMATVTSSVTLPVTPAAAPDVTALTSVARAGARPSMLSVATPRAKSVATAAATSVARPAVTSAATPAVTSVATAKRPASPSPYSMAGAIAPAVHGSIASTLASPAPASFASSALAASPSPSAPANASFSTTEQSVPQFKSSPEVHATLATQSPLPSEPNREKGTASREAGIRVKIGDSLWKLAARHLGNGLRWHELVALNPELSNPHFIRVGDWIRLRPADPRNAKEVVVHGGDTLWSIAQNEFGDPRSFMCIADANPQIQSANLIRLGQTLILPANCPVAR